jgi:hypothetical protein
MLNQPPGGGEGVRVSFLIWDVRLSLGRLLLAGGAAFALHTAADNGQSSLVTFFVSLTALGMLAGGLLATFNAGALGVGLETFANLICFGAGHAAFNAVREHAGPCLSDSFSVRLVSPLVFPVAFLVLRAVIGFRLDDKVEMIRRDLGGHSSFGVVLGPLLGPPETRGTSHVRHVALVERLIGVALGFIPYTVTLYLLFRVLGGPWLVEASTILSPIIDEVDVIGNQPEVLQGFAEALAVVLRDGCR